MISYHLSYSEELEEALLDESKFPQAGTNDGFVLTGRCTTCGDITSMQIPIHPSTIPTGGTLSEALSTTRSFHGEEYLGYVQPSNKYISVPFDDDLYCACSIQHDTTGGESGCGTWARIRISLTINEENLTLVRSKPIAGQPSPEDPKWHKKAQEAQLEALPKMRSIAEKWAATVGTIVGIFGTAALISAPSISDIAPTARVAVVTTIACTVGIAAIAVILASLAAQGGSGQIPPTGPEYKKLAAEETQRARNLLNVSRVLTMVALVPLLIAIIVAFTNPKPESSQQTVSVTYQMAGAGARTICGTLQESGSGIKVRPAKEGKADISLPLSKVITITPVKACAD